MLKLHTGSNRLARVLALGCCSLVLILLAGCLYPEDQTPGIQGSAREAVQLVQDAVNHYQEATGLLPLQNADESTPVYEKFRIDFAKLKRMGYMTTLPKLAFENGGRNQFLILDEESKPQVKLLDITVYQGIRAVQDAMDAYVLKSKGQIPAGDEVYPGFRSIDYKKLRGSDPKLKSMFSGRTLELIVDEGSRVYADYGIDVAKAVEKSGAVPKADTDLRSVLVNESYYVPVKSPVYRWVNGEPQAFTK